MNLPEREFDEEEFERQFQKIKDDLESQWEPTCTLTDTDLGEIDEQSNPPLKG